MDITIDRLSEVPIYRQIVDRIREMITSGTLPEGFRLPPERRLADALGVNRSTILNAYRELKADALVDAHVGRGTVVLPRPPLQSEPLAGAPMPWRQLFREGAVRGQDPILRDLLEITERPEVISLSIGLPGPELLPLATLREILDRLVDEVGPRLLLHSPSEGHTPLRDALSRWAATRGIRCSAAEILILSGSQLGLDLATRAFLDPGDLVVLEEPTYLGALQAFGAAQARIMTVPVDEQGMRTDVLASILERYRPRLIYTLPTFQNPSGAVLSLERRRELLELAWARQVPILEDDPYGELRYEGERVPSLKALDARGQVIYLSTFSKILFPGMRLGWLVAPRQVVRQLTLLRQTIDLHTSSLGQWLLERFISEGHLEPYLQSLRTAYRRRRDAMVGALENEAPEGMSWRAPDGGFYVWCTLPPGVEPGRLFARAAEVGVAYLPGWACFPDRGGEHHLRLTFSYESPETIRQGVRRLMTALDHLLAEQPGPGRDDAGLPPIV